MKLLPKDFCRFPLWFRYSLYGLVVAGFAMSARALSLTLSTHATAIPEITLHERFTPQVPNDKADQLINKFLEAKPATFGDLVHRWRVNAALSRHTLEDDTRPITFFPCFHKMYPASPAVIHNSNTGWQIRTARLRRDLPDGWQAQFHQDQVLGTLAEIGAPLDLALDAGMHQLTVADLLKSSRDNFDIGQECDWSLLAYLIYSPQEPTWTNRFGETCSIDQIIEKMLSDDLGKGPCAGTHHQFMFARLLSAGSASQLVTHRQRRRIEHYLAETSRVLDRSQRANGAWDYAWYTENVPPELQGSAEQFDSLVQVTAHHLEWICRAPKELRPSDGTCARAARFIANALEFRAPDEMIANYCGYSHAASALAFMTRH
jgi:hypothetical protein